MLEPYLHHAGHLVRQYAVYGSYLFDDKDIVRCMPGVLGRLGPTPELAYFLSWRRGLFEPESDRLIRSLAGRLRSKSTLVLAGALQSLEFMKRNGDNRAVMASVDALVAERAESLANHTSPEVLQPLALYLGGVKTDQSRRVLWRMVEQGKVPQQALICLTWIGDVRDLSRLARLP